MAINYKPIAKTITATAIQSGGVLDADITVGSWGIFFLGGTAYYKSGTTKIYTPSGAVRIWLSGSATTGPASITAYADVNARYGVTVKSGIGLTIKFYSKGAS